MENKERDKAANDEWEQIEEFRDPETNIAVRVNAALRFRFPKYSFQLGVYKRGDNGEYFALHIPAGYNASGLKKFAEASARLIQQAQDAIEARIAERQASLSK